MTLQSFFQNGYLTDLGYLVAIIFFILGLRQLSHPDTARIGNIKAAIGMGLGIVLALVLPRSGETSTEAGGFLNYGLIVGGIVIGGGIGMFAAKKVQMTAMPELVSMFNGLGGACAVVISMVELNKYTGDPTASATQISTGLLAMFVGGTAFTGSLIAYFKLSGSLKDSAIKIPGSTYVNIFLLLVMVAGIIFFTVTGTGGYMTVLVLLAISLIYGFTFVIPIGGGDMPVVISLLNAFTGIAAALAGLVYANKVMLFGGILVGASGTILTMLMCEAMNRSLFNVIIGGFGGSAAGGGGSDGDQTVKEMSLPDVAILLNYASSVVVVPGYGMAVAQAQNVCHDLEQELAKNGVEVTYAVHPVAGRMPGHMNVLLAEADVPYERLLDLEAANEALAKADVSIIVGANDVVNPAALDEPGSPVYGMPILRVFDSKRCLVMKRSMNPGYAGIQNKLFFHEKTYMLFGDAKDTLQKMLSEVKKLN